MYIVKQHFMYYVAVIQFILCLWERLAKQWFLSQCHMRYVIDTHFSKVNIQMRVSFQWSVQQV